LFQDKKNLLTNVHYREEKKKEEKEGRRRRRKSSVTHPFSQT